DLDLRYASAAVMAKELDLFVQAAGFSVEDMRDFMTQVYPNEIQTDPSITGVSGVSGVSVGVPVATGTPLPHAQHAQLAQHTQSHSLGTQATRTSALAHTQPLDLDDVSIQVTPTPPLILTAAPRRLTLRRVTLGCALTALIAFGGYAALRVGEHR